MALTRRPRAAARDSSSTTSASLVGVATRASFERSMPAQLDHSTLRTTPPFPPVTPGSTPGATPFVTPLVTPLTVSAKALPFPTIGRGPPDDPVASVAADEHELRKALGQLPRLGVPEPYPISQ